MCLSLSDKSVSVYVNWKWVMMDWSLWLWEIIQEHELISFWWHAEGQNLFWCIILCDIYCSPWKCILVRLILWTTQPLRSFGTLLLPYNIFVIATMVDHGCKILKRKLIHAFHLFSFEVNDIRKFLLLHLQQRFGKGLLYIYERRMGRHQNSGWHEFFFTYYFVDYD